MSVSFFLRFGVISYESPREFTVMRVGDWRAQKKMDTAAGVETNASKLLIPWFTCDLCCIGIGPNHEEQCLYLYPVYDEKVKLYGKHAQKIEYDVFKICGDCAKRKNRDLPEWLCVAEPGCWEQMSRVKVKTYIDTMCNPWFFTLLYVISQGWSLRAFLSAFPPQKPQVITATTNYQVISLKKRAPESNSSPCSVFAIQDPGIALS
jgi:hypothetical protein